MSARQKAPQPRSPEQEAAARRRSVGEVIRSLRGSMTQAELGEALGGIPQTTISRWEAGSVDLTMQQVFDLEEALRVPRGTIGMSSGFAEAEFHSREVEALLRADPHIHPDIRSDAVRSYRSFVEISKKIPR